MHAACCTVAAIAFAVFYTLCASINTDGYNTATENEVYTNSWSHANFNDDIDDIVPSVVATSKFQSARDEYDNLVSDMLVAWDVLVGVAIAQWIVLRVLHHLALRALLTEAAEAAWAEESDEWADTRRGAWTTRRRLLEARREAFNEVAKPLEPYIAVFVAFAAPAFVMSTSFCQNHSGASASASRDTLLLTANVSFEYGTCDVWCEFLLALRSLFTVAVYLVPRERRAELVAVRSTWHKLCTRVIGCIRCSPAPYALVRDNHAEIWHINDAFDMNAQPESALTQHPSDIDAIDVAAIQTDPSSWRINECDVIKEKLLGAGAFGEVWAGTLVSVPCGPVAIKVLFAGAVDKDGDLVDPNAEEDFHKECAALQRVDSSYLIKFFGFGTNAKGNGFIVTELMPGGSLEDVLHNPERDLLWSTRVKIALQVALGMEHLHNKQMLHRDLKSANVLLDNCLDAKVCDFGLTRVVKPVRQHIAYSPFTGAVRLLPRVDGIKINNGQSALSAARISVSITDVRGTLTKAAGTLQWMAPEVFRGDQNYTRAVDVYSFGVVLWELATRKTPWEETFKGHVYVSDGMETSIFVHLNDALKTGRRPPIPAEVLTDHEAFVTVMRCCWAGDPHDRPTFAAVTRNLKAILNLKAY
jgi:serine/threonine protein kinase